jgi:hypothetical protein
MPRSPNTRFATKMALRTRGNPVYGMQWRIASTTSRADRLGRWDAGQGPGGPEPAAARAELLARVVRHVCGRLPARAGVHGGEPIEPTCRPLRRSVHSVGGDLYDLTARPHTSVANRDQDQHVIVCSRIPGRPDSPGWCSQVRGRTRPTPPQRPEVCPGEQADLLSQGGACSCRSSTGKFQNDRHQQPSPQLRPLDESGGWPRASATRLPVALPLQEFSPLRFAQVSIDDAAEAFR